MKVLINAVAYYRMSDDKQEHSLPAQREAVRAYAAKHGYQIVAEYQDEAISGDETEKRAGFKKMIRDAQERGGFEVILCWDQDRFGRFDTLEAGYWIKPLRDRGIRLETMAQGRVNWDDFAGRIVYAVQQEGKHAYLRDLSRNVARGMARQAREGRWQGGRAPYAYAVQDGRLVPGDPAEIEVVRWLFRSYATTDTSLMALCLDLHRRGVPAPGGGKDWYPSTVQVLLTCPYYKGDFVWNRKHEGKYHGVRDGEVGASHKTLTSRGQRRLSHQPNREEDWLTREKAHEALVDPETWEAVQRKLVSRRGRRTPRPGGGRFLLTGLVYCGHCDHVMYNQTDRNPQGQEFPRLVCGRFKQLGQCAPYRTGETPLVGVVARKIQERFTDPDNLAALKAELRRRLENRQKADPDRAKAVRRALAELGPRIERGAENLLAAPPDLREMLTAALQKLRDEERRLKGELEELGRPAPSQDELLARVDQAVRQLARLPEVLRDAEPARAREVIRQAVARIDCWFERRPYGKRKNGKELWWSPLVRGVIHLRPDAVMRDVQLGGPRSSPMGEIV